MFPIMVPLTYDINFSIHFSRPLPSKYTVSWANFIMQTVRGFYFLIITHWITPEDFIS